MGRVGGKSSRLPAAGGWGRGGGEEFQQARGGWGREGKSSSRQGGGGEEIADWGRDRLGGGGKRRPAAGGLSCAGDLIGDGRRRRRRCGLVPIGSLSLEFFPSVVTVFFPFPSDLEIDSICLVFIEFFLSIGSSKMALVHGWFILGKRILCNFLVSLKILIWFKILFTGVIFGYQRL